jgi:hypothetical protein
MSQPSNINQHLGEAIRSGYAFGPKVATGGTLDLQSKSQVCFELAAGTYKVPNAARFTEVMVYASGAVTLTLVGGTTIVTIASGDVVKLVASSTSAWKVVSHTSVVKTLTTSYGFVPIPLTQWRETGTDDTLAVVPGAGLGAGGVLGTDSTPALEYINGDTNSSLRILWAASGVQPIVTQVILPADLDETQPIYFKAVGVMSGTSNTPVLSLDTYFTELAGGGMTKVEDNTSAFTDAVDVQTATIAASDFSSLVNNNTPLFATIEVTPGAHGTDSLAIYGTYLQYTKTLLTA